MPKTKLRLETAHQNTTGVLGVFKSWWPGDKNKPKNADVNGFKVILKHPHVERAIHIRTFNKAEDAAKVIAAWKHLTRNERIARIVLNKTNKDVFKDVFIKAFKGRITTEKQAMAVNHHEIAKLVEKNSLLESDTTMSASTLLAMATQLFSFE